MTRLLSKILPILAMLVMVAPVALSRDDTTGVSNQDRRKAEYMFLEAQNEKSHGNNDAYYDLVKRAHEIDPTNTSISFHLGFCMITMENTTRDLAQQGLELMKEHFNAHPEDFYETTFYSDANMALGNPGEALKAIKSLCDRNPYRIELQSRLAEAYARVGDFAASNETYDSIAALHGRSLEISTKKISNYVTMNDTVNAIAEMRSLLATAPMNVDYNITMGSVMQQFGMRDSALVYLDKAQEAEPGNGYTYLAKAQYYMMNGDSVQHEKQIYQALISEKLDIDTKVQLLASTVRQMIATNDSTDRANKLFTALIDQHPHEAVVHDLYCEYLIYKKDYHAAAEQQSYVVDINPTDAESWRKLMIVQMMGEDFPAAIKSADKALEYNPDSLSLYRYIGPAYYQMKEYDKALEIYKTALAMADSTDLDLLSDLKGGMGDVYQELDNWDMASKCYDESLEYNPANVGIMNNYAYFLSLKELELDKAERMAALAVKSEPNSSTYLDTYAWVFYKKKDYKMALLYIKSAIDNEDEHSADVLDHYGDILFMNGETEAALEQWKKALEVAPDNELIQKKVKHKTIFNE
ncbi:MAG: tetratricopeptide repeat protein [Bacteroidales bacterium]|nr:tetratricopeptide repeat protein [Candidatus Sodaliphilus fimicaballi]